MNFYHDDLEVPVERDPKNTRVFRRQSDLPGPSELAIPDVLEFPAWYDHSTPISLIVRTAFRTKTEQLVGKRRKSGGFHPIGFADSKGKSRLRIDSPGIGLLGINGR